MPPYLDLHSGLSAAVCAAPGSGSFPHRPPGDAERDDGVDRPPAWPDGDDGQGEQDRGGLGSAHQVLGALASDGARAEPLAQPVLGDPEHSMMITLAAVSAMPSTVVLAGWCAARSRMASTAM